MNTTDVNNQFFLTAEERKRLIEETAKSEATSCIKKQREILTQAVTDIQNKTKGKSSVERKKYACRTHCKEIGLNADNYCVAIQFSTLYKAGKGRIDGNDNPLCLKTVDYQQKSPMCEMDSAYCSASCNTKCSMAYYASGGYVENSTCNNDGKKISYDQRIKDRKITVSSYVDANGYVRKDASGKPKLQDGDFMYIEVGKASNTSTGLHCVRVNVDDKGKVTYTGGNNERVNAPFTNYYMNKPVAVFHTSEYVKDCFEYQLERMNDKELLKMAEKNGVRVSEGQKDLKSTFQQQKTNSSVPQQGVTEQNKTKEQPVAEKESSFQNRLAQNSNSKEEYLRSKIMALRGIHEKSEENQHEDVASSAGNQNVSRLFLYKKYQGESRA